MDDSSNPTDELTLDHVTVVRKRRPRAWWGVLAALGLAAGALVVTSNGGDGTTRPGLPVSLGSSVGGGEASMAADMMRAPVTYVAGPDLPLLGGDAPAYRLRGTVDEAKVRALADTLGLTGEITRDGPSWSLTTDTGMLSVFDGGAVQWWYSNTVYGMDRGSVSSSGSGVACPEPVVEPDGTIEVGDPSAADLCGSGPVTTIPADACAADTATDCAVPGCDPTSCSPECPPGTDCGVTTVICPADAPCPDDTVVEPPVPTTIPPPADLPSEEEARAQALDLLAATGIDVDGAAVTVDGPYDAWFVTVEPRLEGLPTGLFASVSVGSKGVITSAGGFLAVPERLGDYPVLDTRAAIDRANAQPAIDPAYRGGVGMEAQVGVADATEGGAAGGGGSTDCLADDTCATMIAGDCTEETTCYKPMEGVEDPVTTIVECTVVSDGTESCVPPELTCEEWMATSDVPLGAPETTDCLVPNPTPVPLPEPDYEPLEVVLVDAVPSLVMLNAVDGSTDLYLVPGYRFEASDSGQVDLPAVADEALTAPPTTDTSAVPPVEPPVTDTAVPPPSTPTTSVPPTDRQLEVGVGYYVDVDTQCPGFLLGGDLWTLEKGDLSGWSTPHEGGTFTLDDPDHGTFVGDAGATKTAWFARAGDPATIRVACLPTPRP